MKGIDHVSVVTQVSLNVCTCSVVVMHVPTPPLPRSSHALTPPTPSPLHSPFPSLPHNFSIPPTPPLSHINAHPSTHPSIPSYTASTPHPSPLTLHLTLPLSHPSLIHSFLFTQAPLSLPTPPPPLPLLSRCVRMYGRTVSSSPGRWCRNYWCC